MSRRDAGAAPRFELRGVSISYGGRPAVAGVDLRIPRDGVTAIVGPSGCGKSSLLSSLNRLTDLVPGCRVDGEVSVDGEDVRGREVDVRALRRRVGMVFQRPNPLPLSIRENLALPLREGGASPDEVERTVRAALVDVGLWPEVEARLGAPARVLSGGQQQRLCIARALALAPEAILFDEPCSALDPIATGVIEELIVRIAETVTVLIVTHNLAQARRIADRVVVMWPRDEVGGIVEQGDVRRVFEDPRDPAVRDYVRGLRG